MGWFRRLLVTILDRLEATLGCEHASIDVDVSFTSFLRARPHTCWGSWGAPEPGIKFPQVGLAVEAWALPRYLPSVKYHRFREIERLYSLNEEESDYHDHFTRRSGGSGRIEDACGESPAASYFGLLSLGEVQIIRSLFVHYSLLFVHYANEAIQESCYGFLGRFWSPDRLPFPYHRPRRKLRYLPSISIFHSSSHLNFTSTSLLKIIST